MSILQLPGAHSVLSLYVFQRVIRLKRRKVSKTKFTTCDVHEGSCIDKQITLAIEQKQCHPVLKFLQSISFDSFRAQQCLTCHQLNVAPIADLVCKRKDRLCVVEIKCGSIKGFKSRACDINSHFKAPFEDEHDTWHNRAMMQACLQAVCLEEREANEVDAYVLRYEPDTTTSKLYKYNRQKKWKKKLKDMLLSKV